MNTKTKSIVKKFVHSRIVIVMAILMSVVTVGGAVTAYGPQRPTFTIENPADYITFNSITNNPNYGDERNFTTIKDVSHSGPGGWKDTITVENGKEYIVSIYVHNNAHQDLNLVSTNTRVSASVPATTANNVQIDGFITADNANPNKIWDSVVMTSDKKFNISYVQGSARFNNNINPGAGFTLSNDIVTSTGALVGYTAMDGKVPGCFQYDGVASFRVKVNMPSSNFTVEKKVRLSGTTAWQENITAQPGQKVDYQIAYTNNGTTEQSNVMARDELPAEIKYTSNTTTLRNSSNPNGNGLAITSNNLVSSGINIGNYVPGGNAYVRFSAVLPSSDKLAVCGPNPLVNTGIITTQNGVKSDTATVTVVKPCAGTLPTTGPVEVVAGFIGVAAITIGVIYYVRSRRDLENALLHVQSHPASITHDHKEVK